MRKPRSLSRTARKVLLQIHHAHQTAERDSDARLYGLQIMDLCGVSSGTLYPILARLVERGLIVATPEKVNPSEAGRPARIYYAITSAGIDACRTCPGNIEWVENDDGSMTPVSCSHCDLFKRDYPPRERWVKLDFEHQPVQVSP